MNWMFESRSKNYDYDDSEGGGYSPPMTWREILLVPLSHPFSNLLRHYRCLDYSFGNHLQ